MALKHCCGADCGIGVVGTASAGVEHWSTASAAVSVVTSGPVPMRSKRAFRMNPSAAACVLTHTFGSAIPASATAVARFWIYFASLPTANVAIFLLNSGSGNRGIIFNQADSTLRCGSAAGTGAASGITVTTGRWYFVEVQGKWAVTGDTADGRVNGVALTQYSSGTTSATCTGFSVGQSTAWTGDYYVDDISVFDNVSHYPPGPGSVVALFPNRDGTHSFNTSGDFKKGASGGTNAASSDTDLWQSLQNPLSSTIGANWIADAAGTGTEYVEFLLESMPAALYINGANFVDGSVIVATTHSATSTANNFQIIASDGSTDNTVMSLDLSETTITIPSAILPLDLANFLTQSFNSPTSGADPSQWRLRFRSSDVSPNPFLDGICLEVSIGAMRPRPTIVRQAVQRRAVR